MQTEIQTIIFQIVENEKNTDEAVKAEKKKEFLESLYAAVKNAEELYIAYNEQTGYPHIDTDGCIWMFSAKEYADAAEDYYRQQMIMLSMRQIPKEKIMGVFAQLYTWGMEQVRLDNGQYTTAIERGKILPPPDWSNTPKIQIPVMNPVLQKKMITFFQNLNSRVNYEGKKEVLHRMEAEMLDEVLKGKYIVPMQIQQPEGMQEEGTIPAGSQMIFANLADNRDQTNWLPAFTDWNEFEKVYDKKQWNGTIMAYEDLCAVSKEKGIVVNPAGVNFRISAGNKKAIEQFWQEERQAEAQREPMRQPEQSMPEPAPDQNPTPEATQMPLSETLENELAMAVPMTQYPASLINAASRCMNYMPEVRRGYAVQILYKNEPYYLIVVDYLGDENKVFGELYRNLPDTENGIRVLLHEADAVGLELVKNVKPFFKRGLFG